MFLKNIISYFVVFLFFFVPFVQAQIYSNPNYDSRLVTEKNQLYSSKELTEYHIYLSPDTLNWLYQSKNLNSDYEFKALAIIKNGVNVDTLEDVGFRLRGNTSRQSAKKSFKIDINEYVKGRRYRGVKSINLNGEHNDPSVMRAKLSWDLFQSIGMIGSRAAHAKVFINEEYYGLYVSVEHIDDEFIAERFEHTSGNLYKCLYPADLNWLGTHPDLYKLSSDGRRVYELKTNKSADDYTGLRDFIEFLNQTNDADFQNQVEDRLDVDGLLRWLSVDILTGNWDNYWHNKNNYYLYHDFETNLFHFIPYDYDNTFGIAWDDLGWAGRNPYSWTPTNESRKLVSRVLDIPEYRNRLSYYLNVFIEEVFSADEMSANINRLKNLVQQAAEEDTYRTKDYGYSVQDFNRSFTESTGAHDKYGLLPYIESRNNSLDHQLNIRPIPAAFLQVKAKIVSVLGEKHLSVSGLVMDDYQDSGVTAGIRFLSSDDEVLNDSVLVIFGEKKSAIESGKFNLSIPVQPNNTYTYQLFLRDHSGNESRYPRNPEHFLSVTISSEKKGLVLNEFMASNTNTIQDEVGEYEDWLELWNSSTEDISLKDLFLTDSPSKPTQFALPDTVLPAGAYLLVWLDDDSEQGVLHANFKLSKSGEFLGLYANHGNTVLDSLSFGAQQDDISFARMADGFWDFAEKPTPGYSNLSTPIEQEMYSLPKQSQLSNIFPNPFNPQTQISFQVIKPERIQLDVYDILGRKIRNLVPLSLHQSGFYQVSFDGSGLASGMYLVVFKSSNNQQVQKMMLVK